MTAATSVRHTAPREASIHVHRPAGRVDIVVAVAVGVIAVHAIDALVRKPGDRGLTTTVGLAVGAVVAAVGATLLVRRRRALVQNRTTPRRSGHG